MENRYLIEHEMEFREAIIVEFSPSGKFQKIKILPRNKLEFEEDLWVQASELIIYEPLK